MLAGRVALGSECFWRPPFFFLSFLELRPLQSPGTHKQKELLGTRKRNKSGLIPQTVASGTTRAQAARMSSGFTSLKGPWLESWRVALPFPVPQTTPTSPDPGHPASLGPWEESGLANTWGALYGPRPSPTWVRRTHGVCELSPHSELQLCHTT